MHNFLKLRIATVYSHCDHIKMQVTSLLAVGCHYCYCYSSVSRYSYVCTELDHILNHAMQSASMENFVKTMMIFLRIVTMENG